MISPSTFFNASNILLPAPLENRLLWNDLSENGIYAPDTCIRKCHPGDPAVTLWGSLLLRLRVPCDIVICMPLISDQTIIPPLPASLSPPTSLSLLPCLSLSLRPRPASLSHAYTQTHTGHSFFSLHYGSLQVLPLHIKKIIMENEEENSTCYDVSRHFLKIVCLMCRDKHSSVWCISA